VSPSEALNAAALVGVVFTVTTTAAVMALTVTVIVWPRAVAAAIILAASCVRALVATPCTVPVKPVTVRTIEIVEVVRRAVLVAAIVPLPEVGLKTPAVQLPMLAVTAHPHSWAFLTFVLKDAVDEIV
jgi:hypothetical protein